MGQQNRPWAGLYWKFPKVSACWKSCRPEAGRHRRDAAPTAAAPSLPPRNTFLTFPTHLPGPGRDSHFTEIQHFSLCHFFWLKQADLGGSTFILQAYFDTRMYQTAVQTPLCAPLAFPPVRAVLGNISRSKSNLGVHLRLRMQGCATTPASPACPVPGPPSLGFTATATREQGRESGFHLQLTEMIFLSKNQLFPSTLRAFVPIAAGRAQPRWLRLRPYLPHPPLSPKHQARVEIVFYKGRETSRFSW